MLAERQQTSEKKKLSRAIVCIVAWTAYTKALAKSETRIYCGLGSQFCCVKLELAPSIPLAGNPTLATASWLDDSLSEQFTWARGRSGRPGYVSRDE